MNYYLILTILIMLRNLSNFASLELTNAEEIKGGSCYVPKSCYPVNRGCKSSKSKKAKKCKGPKSPKSPKSSKNCGVQLLST